MSIYVPPSTSFEATGAGFPSGITGTLGVRIVDNAGATVIARTTAGIIEHPAGSGLYAKTFTSPTVPGQYTVVWDTGGTDVSWAAEELVVQIPVTTPSVYTGDTTARDSLLPIIYRVRLMIDDPGGEGQAFSDAQIEAALDLRADEARYIPLTEIDTTVPGPNGGTVTTYLDFRAPVGDWEDGVALVNSSYAPLTPDTSDLIRGRWAFEVEPDIPVLLSGWTHDLYGAAGDLLLQRATVESASFDVGADGLNLSRSQKAAAYSERGYAYLAKARTRTSNLVRTDEAR